MGQVRRPACPLDAVPSRDRLGSLDGSENAQPSMLLAVTSVSRRDERAETDKMVPSLFFRVAGLESV
jgi:hypothetical protein